MRYYLLVGEASGDLHASHLMRALCAADANAEFRFFGGDEMNKVGGTLVKHYSLLAYMGFIPVLLHLSTILRALKLCKTDIMAWNPDVLILVDYPGFNLKVAQYIRKHTAIPIVYFIPPKIWAWKEHRIHQIKRDIHAVCSILPFEVAFYQKHHLAINYVGNPTVDEVMHYISHHTNTLQTFAAQHNLPQKPIIALLAGSRKQEIKDNLPRMIAAASAMEGFQMVVAGAPHMGADFYEPFVKNTQARVVYDATYPLLHVASAALVTSGTATLETALFGVPQVVCYYTAAGRLVSLLRRWLLKVPYVSLVNLIANREVVKELVAHEMTVPNIVQHLRPLLHDATVRQKMLTDYGTVRQSLGECGAATHTAQALLELIAKSQAAAPKQ